MPQGPKSTQSRKRRHENSSTSAEVDRSIISYLESKKSNQPDDIDNFFSSMASSVRALPPKKRAEVKFTIHQIIHNAEMEATESE